jgi:hypothetical protein
MEIFNETHPELLEGEMFLSNQFGLSENAQQNPFFVRLQYPSKRFGIIAYQRNGVKLKNAQPVFILISDYDEYMNRKKS